MASVDIPGYVLTKLILFTAAMIIIPILSFFWLKAYTDSDLVSGGVAAIMANVVLIFYIIVAFTEDIPTGDESIKDD
ncbi:Vma21p [Ascoidea rubescens DSM 1968]|uniref:Putative vacuolar ATPase assembly integral membrane protein n=1 Tax=Ascoidea rubescens DSM 1968 TaxID=1344418 RepID=A0A1D2VK71_9ASCO|nr:putative vacuolar ATPase assembly integral membrane protein [Ascoidea rubescens DSM 1968]ODV61989.1 putative vacuolar ATPase assembly integral membrane protein [Ascoidea rubescens DSM 1968]